jgi:hypothetical protein
VSIQAELQRACSLCVALEAAEVATLQVFLVDPATDRLRELSMLGLERAQAKRDSVFNGRLHC